MADKNPEQARLRLIDHFKRVYTIVAGLAITEAVKQLFPIDPDRPPTIALCMFFTFFITIVPIFHGGDRSLDFKYAAVPQDRAIDRIAYVWDVYMLLFTAALFVAIAKSIPIRISDGDNTGAYPRVGMFYLFTSLTLIFDVFVLIVDKIKNWTRENLSTYFIWIIANALLGALCGYVAYVVGVSSDPHASDDFGFLCFTLSLKQISVVVLMAAIARTLVDYATDHFSKGRFLFP